MANIKLQSADVPDVTVTNLVSSNIPEGETVTITQGDSIVTQLTGTFRVYTAGPTPPDDKRQLWMDTDPALGGLKYWTGTEWKSAAASKVLEVADTPPVDTRMLWLDTNATTGGLKYHNGTDWVLMPVGYTA